MMNDIVQVAYGSYEPCEKCGVSALSQPGWGCVCDLLIDAGNCPKCMLLPERCVCEHAITRMTPPSLLSGENAEIEEEITNMTNITPFSPATPVGYQRVVHRCYTEFVPLDFPVALTPCVLPGWNPPTEPLVYKP